MRYCAVYLLALVLLSLPAHTMGAKNLPLAEPSKDSTYAGETLKFKDDFSTFDFNVWEHEITAGGGGNWEFQYYTNNRTNSYVRDGVLYIKPTLTADKIGMQNLYSGYELDLWGSQPANLCTGNAFWGCKRIAGGGGNIINPIQSARLRTVHSMNIKYGRVEIRARLPRGKWLWPAFWMLPRRNRYGEWPASGEIDIMESRGNAKGYIKGGINAYGSTLHWGPHHPENGWKKTHAYTLLDTGDFGDEFHIFGLKWSPEGIYTYLDNESNKILDVKWNNTTFWQRGGWGNTFHNPWQGGSDHAPFDQEFYLVMNVAVGGTQNYFPDGYDGKPWRNKDGHAVNRFWEARNDWLPTWGEGEECAMAVDWVKVWQ